MAKVPLSPEASMKKLSNHPVISQEWMKDQMQQIRSTVRYLLKCRGDQVLDAEVITDQGNFNITF